MIRRQAKVCRRAASSTLPYTQLTNAAGAISLYHAKASAYQRAGDANAAERAATRILESIRKIHLPGERKEMKLSCSGGLASTTELPTGFSAEEAVKAADEALYRAKQTGRDRLHTTKPARR